MLIITDHQMTHIHGPLLLSLSREILEFTGAPRGTAGSDLGHIRCTLRQRAFLRCASAFLSIQPATLWPPTHVRLANKSRSKLATKHDNNKIRVAVVADRIVRGCETHTVAAGCWPKCGTSVHVCWSGRTVAGPGNKAPNPSTHCQGLLRALWNSLCTESAPQRDVQSRASSSLPPPTLP